MFLIRLTALLIAYTLFSTTLFAQEIVLFSNPSFEDAHGQGRTPVGWYYCGPVDRSPPDIHHTDFPRANFEVSMPAADGKTYVGMVGREDGTVEAIGQQLSTPLKAGQCYTFSFFLAKSEKYISRGVRSPGLSNFDEPLRLAIWGGGFNCAQEALLGMSALVYHTDWKRHIITIHPKRDYDHIQFQIFYDNKERAYNGNILLDGFSPIIPVSCDTTSVSEQEELLRIEDTPEFQDRSAFFDFLRATGSKIKYDRTGYMLESHYFMDEKGHGQQGNYYLWKLVRTISVNPSYQQEWMIAERDVQKYHSLKRHLQYELHHAGLTSDQFKIIDYKRSLSKGDDWLWSRSANPIMLRLILVDN